MSLGLVWGEAAGAPERPGQHDRISAEGSARAQLVDLGWVVRIGRDTAPYERLDNDTDKTEETILETGFLAGFDANRQLLSNAVVHAMAKAQAVQRGALGGKSTRVELGAVGTPYRLISVGGLHVYVHAITSSDDRAVAQLEVLGCPSCADRTDRCEPQALQDALLNERRIIFQFGCVFGMVDEPAEYIVERHCQRCGRGACTGQLDDFAMRNRVFLEALEAQGRRRSDVTVSTILTYDGNIEALVRSAAAFDSAGIDLGIIRLAKTDDPAVVESLAEALSSLT